MILSSTLNSLTEEELSILFYIGHQIFLPQNIDIKFDYLKMLRVHTIIPMIDFLKTQALEDKIIFFDSLKEKISNQI